MNDRILNVILDALLYLLEASKGHGGMEKYRRHEAAIKDAKEQISKR